MLVVLANRYDQQARTLVSRWGSQSRLLSIEDFSTRGWRFTLDDDGDSFAVIDGEVVNCKEIKGVFTRLPFVFQDDLVNITPGDRAYVAAEMMAFLLAWLSSLRCPVLNKPTPLCLSGPLLRREKWVHTASELGLPVLPVNRHSPMVADEETDLPKLGLRTVELVGDTCIGHMDEGETAKIRSLARRVGADLLRARFTDAKEGSLFVDADYWVDVSNPEIADAVLRFLRGEN